MKTVQKITLLSMLLFSLTAAPQAEGDDVTVNITIITDKNSSSPLADFAKPAFCLFCINGLVALSQDQFIPAKPLIASAFAIGMGKWALSAIDQWAHKRNPKSTLALRNSTICKGLVYAAGLTPIIMSNSRAGECARYYLKPAAEYAVAAGARLADTVLLQLSTIVKK